MYFNNLHILCYVLIAFLGLAVGKFISYADEKMIKEEKVFSKNIFKEIIKNYDFNYFIMISIGTIYVFLLYKFGWKDDIWKNLDIIKFLILTPMIVSAFYIDCKHRIIPNRLNMTIFETGIILTLVYGYNNINVAKDMILGLLVGAGIFIIITVLGGIIAGKEAMGLGDVKFMGAVGLFFGASNIAQISLLAFFIAAFFSIIILIIRNLILRKKDEYIAFGPFLSLASIACIFLPSYTIWNTFIFVCNSLSDFIIRPFI